MMRSIFVLAGVVLIFLMSKCAAVSGGASTTVTISGSLTAAAADNGTSVRDIQLQALTTYAVRCVTLSGTPTAGQGTADSAGAFSLSLASAVGVPIGCFVINATTSSVVAMLSFVTAGTDISGSSSSSSGSYVAGAGGALILGAVTLDVEKGTAVVQTANIVAPTGAVTGTFENMTGTWGLTCVEPPTGDLTYSKCSARSEQGGPPESIYFHQVDGVLDGAGKTHSGFSIWESASGYTGCGSAEGVTLPSGWTSSDTSLTKTLTLASLNMNNITVQSHGGGPGVCNATAGTACSAITSNPNNWGTGSVTYSVADCKAQCVVQGAYNATGSCPARWSVDWSKSRSITSAGDLACNSTTAVTSCGTGSGAGYATRNNSPDDRFISGELIISGSTGSVYSQNTRTDSMCINQTQSGCTNVQCKLTEKVKFTIAQDSATTGTADVSIETLAVTVGTGTDYCNQNVQGNWNYSRLTPQRFLIKVKKAS